jgi:hypothetical protein
VITPTGYDDTEQVPCPECGATLDVGWVDVSQDEPNLCYCGDPECWHWSPRTPECAVNEQGQALRWDGVPWDDTP